MKKITSVIITVIMVLNTAGCASVPAEKYLNRLSDEDREEVQKGVEFNRSMWQLGSAGLGVLAGCGGSGSEIAFTASVLSLSFVGIASLCNLHTYRENDTEKAGLITGLIAGGILGGAISFFAVGQNLANPNEFMFLPLVLAPIIIISFSITGGGFGALIGKFTKGK